MSQTFEAVYDGAVFRPDAAVALEPNTRVKLTLEIVADEKAASFLDVAESSNLEGPGDWSRNIDRYLYGEQSPRS